MRTVFYLSLMVSLLVNSTGFAAHGVAEPYESSGALQISNPGGFSYPEQENTHTPVSSPFSTIEGLPGPTATPSQTPPTEPTAAPIAVTTVTPSGSDDLRQAERAILLSSDPQWVNAGQKFLLVWSLPDWESLALRQELVLHLSLPEAGLHCAGQASEVVGMIALPVKEGKGALACETEANLPVSYKVQAVLTQAGVVIARGRMIVRSSEQLFALSQAGGVIETQDRRIRVSVPGKALSEALNFKIIPSEQMWDTSGSLSGHPFEILAFRPADESRVNRFSQEIVIEVAYDEAQLSGDEKFLYLFYYAEEKGHWLPLKSEVDTENNLLRGWSDHLTQFDYGTISPDEARAPNMDAFQVSNFTGAGSYAMEFWTPPAPGGLQPELRLSYNSQVADGTTQHTQASWVGLGWSLGHGLYSSKSWRISAEERVHTGVEWQQPPAAAHRWRS